MIARFPDSLLLICNAARKAADEAHLRDALSDCCEIEVLDSALIALQGPSAEFSFGAARVECLVNAFYGCARNKHHGS